ncbi:hypothetical protein L210DRAFT_2551831 [Boletus edulis BED1]|uniref:Cx9C motif-containing protein 4, mitochondrial n=1 Tax=Boletus edulis BED1 TaxID=1328754 RepID=A0AAD4BNS1_BOLED|nr:hypothetical protein L210DRAFT_2551831 [Boletus edulis BED1]
MLSFTWRSSLAKTDCCRFVWDGKEELQKRSQSSLSNLTLGDSLYFLVVVKQASVIETGHLDQFAENAEKSCRSRPQQCQEQACSLQTCLSRNTYSPEKCNEYVRKLYLCCLDMYSTRGDANIAVSTACPAMPVIERWLKRNNTETQEQRQQ